MKANINEVLLKLIVTLIIFVFLEIFSSAIIPALGFRDFTLAFSVLLIIFMGFRITGAYLPWFILIVQIFHSAFSVEGWAVGTFAGIVVCVLINYLKDLMQLSSVIMTIIVVEVFQLVWFLIVSSIIAAKLGDFSLILDRIARILPETIVLALFSPIFFRFLGLIWREREDDQGVSI